MFSGNQHHHRPTESRAGSTQAAQIPKVSLFKIDEVVGGWAKVQWEPFADGDSFDKSYSKQKARSLPPPYEAGALRASFVFLISTVESLRWWRDARRLECCIAQRWRVAAPAWSPS